MYAGPVVLYAKNYATADTQFINAYLNRTMPTGIFNFARTPEPLTHTFTVNFHLDNVTITDNNTTIQAEIVSETDSTLTIAQIDSTRGWEPYNPNWCYKLYSNAKLIQPQKNCIPIPSIGEYDCKFRQLFPCRKINGELFIPVMTIQAGVGWTCFYATRDISNIFNGTLVNDLKATDTIVVQQKTIRLVRQ